LAQLDQVLPLDARKKGVAIASAKAKTTPPPSSKPVQALASRSPAKAGAQPKAKNGAIAPPGPRPSPGNTVAAATPIPATGAWRIQLGAFSQRASAEALYRKLSGALAGHQPVYIPAGALTRLQVGPYPTRAAAQAACIALKGQACFPVPGK
jgi:cell division septation protein DedD